MISKSAIKMLEIHSFASSACRIYPCKGATWAVTDIIIFREKLLRCGNKPGRIPDTGEPAVEAVGLKVGGIPFRPDLEGEQRSGDPGLWAIEALVDGPEGGLRAIRRLDLAEQLLDRSLDNHLGERQVRGDHAVAVAVDKPAQDFGFARGQTAGNRRACRIHDQRRHDGRE